MMLTPEKRAELVEHLMHLSPIDLLQVTQDLQQAMAEKQRKLRLQTSRETEDIDEQWARFNGQ